MATKTRNMTEMLAPIIYDEPSADGHLRIGAAVVEPIKTLSAEAAVWVEGVAMSDLLEEDFQVPSVEDGADDYGHCAWITAFQVNRTVTTKVGATRRLMHAITEDELEDLIGNLNHEITEIAPEYSFSKHSITSDPLIGLSDQSDTLAPLRAYGTVNYLNDIQFLLNLEGYEIESDEWQVPMERVPVAVLGCRPYEGPQLYSNSRPGTYYTLLNEQLKLDHDQMYWMSSDSALESLRNNRQQLLDLLRDSFDMELELYQVVEKESEFLNSLLVHGGDNVSSFMEEFYADSIGAAVLDVADNAGVPYLNDLAVVTS